MATNVNSTKSQSQSTPSKSPQHQQQGQSSNFETLDKSTSNTLKRNPKMELSKNDLLKLLSYLEGELQARDVVIATLKSEKVKQLLHQGRYRSVSINDPLAALQRDSYAASEPRVDEAQIRALADHQMASLENLILQQRRAQIRMARILKDAEDRHKKVVQELEEEKRKHEHDTAQGDDITYGLEKERTRLKQELELEKQGKKKLEKEVKKIADTLEEERNRQKQIVLLLLAERKKIIMKYVEERKRSEDLAQILTEEKGRIDSMAEGLEEESKKSLQMEAELEKQLAQFDMERQQLKAAFCKEEKRCKEFESEVEKLRGEVDSVKKQLAEAHQVAMFQAGTNVSPPRVILPRTGSTATPPQPPAKPSIIPPQTSPRPGQPSGPGVPLTPPKVGPWGQPGSPRPDGSISPPPPPAGTPMMSSVAKVVQPTATVSSVPVCGPTTGIARSVSPGQGLRNIAYAPATAQDARTGTSGRGETSSWSATSQPSEQPSPQVPVEKSVARIAPSAERSQPQVVQVTPRVSLSASPGTKVFTTTQGGKVTFHVTANAAAASTSIPPPSQPPVLPGPSSTTQTASTTVPQAPKKPLPLGRGVPPPVPPNKPVVPPKKEVVSRTVVQTGRPDIAVDPNQPISFEVKPQKVGPQGVKFGITISKDKIHITNPQATSSNDIVVSQGGLANASLPNPGTTSALDSNQPIRRDPQVGAPSGEVSQLPQSPVDIQSTSVGAKCETLSLPGSVPTPSSCPASSSKSKATNDDARNGSVVARREVARPALHESPGLDMLGQELADFQEMLVSMATGSSDIAASSTNPFPAQAASSVDDSISPCVSTTSAAITDDEKKEKLMNCCVSVKCPVQDDSAKTSQHCINLNEQDSLGRNPLYYALLHGNEAAAAFLIKQGATLGIITKDNSTILHAAVMSGNVQCVQVVLEALAKQLNHSSQNSPCSAKEFSNLFTRKDDHGKTPLHLAAVLDHDDCLQLLLSYFSDCFLDVRDNDGRTVYDVASKTCKALLYSLHGDHENGGGHYCSVLMCPERHGSQYQIGCLTVDREMTWQALTKKLIGLASNHWEIISKGLELTKKEKRRGHCSASDNKLNQELGLSAKSILRFEIGDHHWIEKAVDDNELLPCEVISNTAKKEIRIILSCKSQLDGLAYEILVPISLLQNYTRLIEQYKNLVFYGPRLVGKTRLATRLVEHLLWKHRSEKRRMIVCFLEFKKCNLDETERVPNGLKSNMDVGHESAPIEVVLNHKTRLKLNEVTGALVECGLLLTAPTTEEANIPVVVLDNICKDVCTSDIGILITGLDKCGATNPLKLGEQQNVYYVNPSSYIIGTMDTAGAIGIDLNLYQNLRWVHLRWDVEPVCGMLNHTLARELLHANGGILPPPYDSSYKLLQWITSVWVRMNESFVGLGLPDSILGPHLLSGCFQSDEHCAPISRQHSVLRFIQNVWNSHVVSEVRRKIFATPHSSAEQQEKVLSVALGVMLLRVVVPNAPLSVTERHSFLRSLTGGSELDSAAVRRKLRGSWAGSTAEERREYLHVGARSKCERKRSRSSCSSPVGEQEKYHPSFTALTETSHIKDISTSSSSNSSDSSESSSHCLQTDLNKTIHQDMPSDSSRDNDEQEGCGSLSVTEEAASDNSELPDEPAFNTLTMELAKLEAALKKSVIGDNGLRVLNVALSSD